MKKHYELPPLPKHNIRITELRDEGTGFLKLHSARVKFEYENGGEAEMICDAVSRKSLDAVGIVAYEKGVVDTFVHLVSCIRPALVVRDYSAGSRIPAGNPILQWEIPAGIVELSEPGLHGVINASRRELREEVGYVSENDDHQILGYPIYPSVGISSERIYLTHVKTNDLKLEVPSTDGSPLERGSITACVEIGACIRAITTGVITDAKTVLGIMRFVDKFGY